MLTILVTLGGILSLVILSVALYPQTPPPIIEVTTHYPGADSRTLADTVASPIEEYVNGVENMTSMTSSCTNNGNYSLTITFRPGTNPSHALVLVQNRVNMAMPKLPNEVKRRGVMVKNKSAGVE